jgi:hypothetical protein
MGWPASAATGRRITAAAGGWFTFASPAVSRLTKVSIEAR